MINIELTFDSLTNMYTQAIDLILVILVNQVCTGNRKEGKKNQNSQYNNYDNIYCNMWIFAGFRYTCICNVNNLCDLLSSIKAVIINVFYSVF